MAGQRMNYGKRLHSRVDYVDNGVSKRRKPADERDPFAPGPKDTVYRYLCLAREVGSIIGRGGEIVKKLRADSQAKIIIGESVPGCEERVVTICSSSEGTNAFGDMGDYVCPAQDALFRVHERLVRNEAPSDEDFDSGASQASIRLLVPSDQIGCIIGKGGQIIQGIRSDTGAHIHILKNEHLPPCATSSDEILQITGEAPVVKKALFQVSSRLHGNPSRVQHLSSDISHAPLQDIHSRRKLSNQFDTIAAQTNNYDKWPHSQVDYADNGGSMIRNFSYERAPFAPGPDDTVYRYLCPGSKVGSIIGRGGETVKQLRADSHANITIGERVPGCEDRVVTIFSSSEKTNSFGDMSDYVCPAQDALFRVHERLVAEEAPGSEDYDTGVPQATVRLLVPPYQIGCLIGKGGKIIKGIRSDTGAHIRISKNEHLPCANSSDELLQISGEAPNVKKALFQVSSCLHDRPSRSQHLIFPSVSHAHMQCGQYEGPNVGGPTMGVAPLMDPYGVYKGDAAGDWPSFHPGRNKSSSKEFGLCLVCPSVNIGGVIGKGGVIINQIRQESGASIRVDSSAAEDDCIISISANESCEDPISSTIDAAVRLQPRCSEMTERESGEPLYTTRLLVPTSQIGRLIGKGGSIITEMRRATRANIRIISKENLSKVASEDDDLVQISGDLNVVRNALIQVASQLKANFFRRESGLSAFASSTPYHIMPTNTSDELKYGARDSNAHHHGHSSYPVRYGASSDEPPSENCGSYGGSQAGGSG